MNIEHMVTMMMVMMMMITIIINMINVITLTSFLYARYYGCQGSGWKFRMLNVMPVTPCCLIPVIDLKQLESYSFIHTYIHTFIHT